jgi:hypothetical protein
LEPDENAGEEIVVAELRNSREKQSLLNLAEALV